MPNVVTPFSRKHHKASPEPVVDARHRREGYFDEKDHWHDAESESAATTGNSPG